METYIINGHEVEYDTFDLDAMELFDGEIKRVAKEAGGVNVRTMNADNYLKIVREQCESVLDFFDTVLGNGSAAQIFGAKINAMEILSGYKKFCKDVSDMRAQIGKENFSTPVNRAQRRVLEREQRRLEEKEREEQKAVTVDER